LKMRQRTEENMQHEGKEPLAQGKKKRRREIESRKAKRNGDWSWCYKGVRGGPSEGPAICTSKRDLMRTTRKEE